MNASCRSALLVLLAACSSSKDQAPPAAAGKKAIDRDADRKAIAKAHKDYDENNSAGDVKRVGDLYAPDAVLMPTGQQPLVGKEAILESLAASAERFYITSAGTSDEILFLADDWALDRGHYKVTVKPKQEGPGGRDETGSYLVLWQRQPDGAWKIARDIDNTWGAPVE